MVIAHSLALWMLWFELANERSVVGRGTQPSPGDRDRCKRNRTWSRRKEQRGTPRPVPCLRQLVVGEVSDDANFLQNPPFDPGGRVELAHSDDLDTASLVVLGDGSGAKETSPLRKGRP